MSNEDLVDQNTPGAPWLPPARQGLYDPANEHDACGLGFIAHIKGEKSHAIVTQGLQILLRSSARYQPDRIVYDCLVFKLTPAQKR